MILKASQRGGGKALALHLINDRDNDHVTMHDMRGFVSDGLVGAFKETEAVSKGTKCKQPFFSLSLSPPANENVSISTYEDALARIEKKLGLESQARAVVFHNKEARTHCHAVYSRIDAESMTAINMAHYKRKLRDISRELYLENDWSLPKGLMNSKAADPRNYTLAEYQQAKRMGQDPRDLKEMMQECWAASDTRAAFEHALSERGLILAKGRRGHVVVTHEGEPLSVARYTGKKAREVRAKLGEVEELPTVEDAQQRMDHGMHAAMGRHIAEAKLEHRKVMNPLEAKRKAMTELHRLEREKLAIGQRVRWEQETQERSARLNNGLRGLFDRLTGHHAKLQRQNVAEGVAALRRDENQRQMLKVAQSSDRRELQTEIDAQRSRLAKQLKELRIARQQHSNVTRQNHNSAKTPSKLSQTFERHSQMRLQDQDSRLTRLRNSDRATHTRNSRDWDLER